MKKAFVIILLAVAGCYGIATAQQPAVIVSGKPGWHKIGETTVNFAKDRDEIAVLGNDRFAALMFKVTDAPVNVQDIEVYFEGGTHQDIAVRSDIAMGGESRVIDLKGGQPEIRKIVMVYKTLPNRHDEKAHVEVWGLKVNKNAVVNENAENARHENAESARQEEAEHDRADDNKNDKVTPKPAIILNDKAGWHKIAETTVDFKKDRDEVAVLGADRFAKIKFVVTDAAVDLQDMDVYYEDGTKQNVVVKSVYKKGGESRVIDLDGREKAIKRISFSYRTIPNQQQDKAHIEIYGLKTNMVR